MELALAITLTVSDEVAGAVIDGELAITLIGGCSRCDCADDRSAS